MHRLRINIFLSLEVKRIFVVSLIIFLSSLLSSPVLAAYSWIETSQSDFNKGVFASATSTALGNLELSREKITLPLNGSFTAGRVTMPDSLSVTSASDAAVTLGQSQTYTHLSPISIGGYNSNNPATFSSKNAVHSFLATSTNVLYVSTGYGLTAIDTRGTTDPSDDVKLINYTTTSSPAIVSNTVLSSFVDPVTGYLFVNTGDGTNDGISVIDPSDKMLVVNYDGNYDLNNIVLESTSNSSFLDRSSGSALLYVNTDYDEGIKVININNITAPILIKAFTEADGLLYNKIRESFLDRNSSTSMFLYAATYNGLSVFSLGADQVPSVDDSLAVNYGSNSNTAASSSGFKSNIDLMSDNIFGISLDKSTGANLLFVSTEEGVTIINIGDPASSTDDVLVENFTTAVKSSSFSSSSNINLPALKTSNSLFDAGSRMLYISNGDETAPGGLLAIYLNEISSSTDDILVSFYSTSSRPSLAGNSVSHSFLDVDKNIYVSADGGLSIIHLGSYNRAGDYYSQPLSLGSTTPQTSIAANATIGASTTVNLAARFGDTEDQDSGAWTAWYEGSDIGRIKTATSTWLQYRATLGNSGADLSATPILNSVDLYADFPLTTGTYISRIFDASSTKHWLSLSAGTTNTASTTTAFYTRSGASPEVDGYWSTWWTATSSISSPDSRYIQYKVELKSDSVYASPQVASVIINYEDAPVSAPAPTTSSSGGSIGGGILFVQTPVATTTASTTTTEKDSNNSIQTEISASKITSTGVVKGEKILSAVQESILFDASIIFSGDLSSLLASVGKKRNLSSEADNFIKFLKPILKQETKLTDENMAAVLNFIVYGTPSVKPLNSGERAGIISAYREAFGASPKNENEWIDILRAANGQAPIAASSKAEEKAAKVFKKIYKRASSRLNANDSLAIKIAAYGIHTRPRDLKAEIAAIAKFRKVYGHKPQASSAWDAVRAIAYSGVKK